jgi:hypothetical protein
MEGLDMKTIHMTSTDPDHVSKIAAGGEVLRSLCRQEAEDFDRYLRRVGREYREGLSRFERLAVEGYIYQKLRGHIDAENRVGPVPGGSQNGKA